MRFSDELMQKLLDAAAKAPPRTIGAPTFALEARALAAWRERHTLDDQDTLLPVLRVGLGLASILTVLIIVFSLREIRKPPATELVLPNAALHLALTK